IEHDPYISRVVDLIEEAVPDCSPPNGCPGGALESRKWPERWSDFRALPEHSCDPVTLAPAKDAALDLSKGVTEFIPVHPIDPEDQRDHQRTKAANGDLRAPGI